MWKRALMRKMQTTRVRPRVVKRKVLQVMEKLTLRTETKGRKERLNTSGCVDS